MIALYVALGAAIGAPARFLIDQYFRKFTSKPIGTFTVNIVGSFLIGLTFADKTHWHDFILPRGQHLSLIYILAMNSRDTKMFQLT